MGDVTLEQAYAILRHHIEEPDGLLDQVEQGVIPREKDLLQLDQVLVRIQAEWKERPTVPKHIMRLLVNLFPRIDAAMQRYPEIVELDKVYFRFSEWIDGLFSDEQLAEDVAVGIISMQMLVVPSLALDLRQRQGVNEVALDFLYQAMDTLTPIWRKREEVSKFAAIGLIEGQEYFISQTQRYQGTKRQRVITAREEYAEKVEQCFQ